MISRMLAMKSEHPLERIKYHEGRNEGEINERMIVLSHTSSTARCPSRPHNFRPSRDSRRVKLHHRSEINHQKNADRNEIVFVLILTC